MTTRQVPVSAYTRTVCLVMVEFICQRQSHVTNYPGPHPKWGSACFPAVRRQQARDRFPHYQ